MPFDPGSPGPSPHRREHKLTYFATLPAMMDPIALNLSILQRRSSDDSLELRLGPADGTAAFEVAASIQLKRLPGAFVLRSLGDCSEPFLEAWADALDAGPVSAGLREKIEFEGLIPLSGDPHRLETERVRFKAFLPQGAELYLQIDLPSDRIALLPRSGWNDPGLLAAFTTPGTDPR